MMPILCFVNIGGMFGDERGHYPAMPSGYFDADATATLVAFQDLAMKRRRIEGCLRFSPKNSWKFTANSRRESALRLYGNWLAHIVHLPTRPGHVDRSQSSVSLKDYWSKGCPALRC
jgi:hypothetical protein